MTYQEKLNWLGKLFSDDPAVCRKAMDENVPQPLFETGEELREAIDQWLAASGTEQRRKTNSQKQLLRIQTKSLQKGGKNDRWIPMPAQGQGQL